MTVDLIDADIERIRELCRVGTLDCLWCTAYYRVMVRDIARNPVADGALVEYTDDLIRAEFRQLLADHPDAVVCPLHAHFSSLITKGGS